MNRTCAARTGFLLSSLLLSAALIAQSGCDSDPKKTGTGGAGGSIAGTGGVGGSAGSAGSAGSSGSAGAGGGGEAGGGATGEAGAGGGAGSGALGGAGGTTPFGAFDSRGNSFQACTSAAQYTANVTTIAYGGSANTYTPACLKVAAGAAVTFSPASTSDSFVLHPLTPSSYGTQPSPIVTPTGGAASATFTFPTPGFYAFFCGVHGSDAGAGMAGVIWVE